MKRLIGFAMIGAGAANIVWAQDNRRPPTEAVQPMLACRALSTDAQRLACFDREVAAFEAATIAQKVIVLDQTQVRETRRSLFGFTMPAIKLFGGGNKEDKAAEEAMNVLDTTIVSVSRLGDGRVSFTIPDGARWVQTDDRQVLLGRVKPGTPVKIERASLGSYFATIKGTVAFRARRQD